jgi:hypothetical protein
VLGNFGVDRRWFFYANQPRTLERFRYTWRRAVGPDDTPIPPRSCGLRSRGVTTSLKHRGAFGRTRIAITRPYMLSCMFPRSSVRTPILALGGVCRHTVPSSESSRPLNIHHNELTYFFHDVTSTGLMFWNEKGSCGLHRREEILVDNRAIPVYNLELIQP